MSDRMKHILRRWWWLLIPLTLTGAVWLLPISGHVTLAPKGSATRYPQMRLDPSSPQPGQKTTFWVTDDAPWSHVLLTVDGESIQKANWTINPARRRSGTWTWKWTFTFPEKGAAEIIFYHDCHTGCIARAHTTVGTATPSKPAGQTPTKLGVVFANPERDWRGRSGWDVELTYARLAGEAHWGIDDLAARVHRAAAQGLRVLVRIDYDYGQSLPPERDELALAEYLQYVQRLARDERLGDVYAYFLGSGYNAQGVTPEWYARVFNGYGEEATHTDNAVQVMRAEDPQARLLVGPLQPWNREQDGESTYAIDAPWLNYFNTLADALDEAARAKAAAGIPLAAPDGFAVQASGRPDAPEMAGQDRADEPRIDLRREAWDGAQAGFRVYRNWLAIINDYPTTRGLPVYVTSTNTFAPDEGIPPAQNYPKGWLTTALDVIDEEPQVKALCWFLDYFPHDTQWEYFSLTRQPGRMLDAAEEFDALLRRE